MKIKYNAPITLTFSFAAAVVLIFDIIFQGSLIENFFITNGAGIFNWSNPLDYIRMFTSVLGHGGFDHLLGNVTFILLLGPVLEEKYGSAMYLVMIFLSSAVIGLIQALLIPARLMGASGIVFMMIILISFVNFKKGEIPLTFILVFLLFLVKEIIAEFTVQDDTSQMAHIIGGLVGILLALL